MNSLKYLRTEQIILPNGTMKQEIYTDSLGKEHLVKIEEDLSSSDVIYHSESQIGGRHATVKGEVLNGEKYTPFEEELKAEDHSGLIEKLGCLLHDIKSKCGV